jgi:hypothetical protein
VLTLKKVARLPSKDRAEVVKVLKKSKLMKALNQKVCNRQRQRQRVTRSLEVNQHSKNDSTSLTSVNNDWKNWVALQGNEKATEIDIQEIGKVIGVSAKGDFSNKFSVLSRSKKDVLGPVLMPVAEGGGSVGGLI